MWSRSPFVGSVVLLAALTLFACAGSTPAASESDAADADTGAVDVAPTDAVDVAEADGATDDGGADADAATDGPDDGGADDADATPADSEDDAACAPGTRGCPCDDGDACIDDLVCVDDLCAPPDCPLGTDGCPCADVDFCVDDLRCDDGTCVVCAADAPGCPCDEGACDEPLFCDRDLCIEPESCADIGCVPLQLCELEELRCVSACEIGFDWVEARNSCVPSGGTSCDRGAEDSLAEECRRQGRECRLVAGFAQCGECVPGFTELEGDCIPGTCGAPESDPYSRVEECAASGRQCRETEDGAECGDCLEGLLIDPDLGECVERRDCEDLDCGTQFRTCDPRDGLARCADCVDGYVELPGTGTCVLFEVCDDLDCAPQSRECVMDVTARCDACLPGWVEDDDGVCVCEATGGSPQQYWPDDDGDGFGDPTRLGACTPLDGYVDNGDDCNDERDDVNPGESDRPDPAFDDTDCDGIDGDAERMVFLATDGDDEGDGTREAPYATLEVATVAAAINPDIDGVAVGVGIFAGPLVVLDGVSVWGGYDPAAGWARNDRGRTVVRTEEAADGRFAGLVASAIETATEIAFVTVETADAPADITAYGAYLVGATGLSLVHVEIQAGRGGDGSHGTGGSAGGGGAAGGAGQAGSAGGAGGGAGRNAACPDADGGLGGRGGNTNEYGENGLPNGCGGLGGEDGRPWDNEGRPGAPGCSRTAAGAPGPDGPGAAATGGVVDDRWVPTPGDPGGVGFVGMGGGGGGGGGGPEILPFRGGGGGGGATGGRGGHGGGGAGGVAFGLYCVDTVPTLLGTNDVTFGAAGAGGGGPGLAGIEGDRAADHGCDAL